LGLAIKAPFYSRVSSKEQELNTNNVVAFRHASKFQRVRLLDRADNLRELENENARLRDSVIALALEIQNLRKCVS
jgi:hypothetical protein